MNSKKLIKYLPSYWKNVIEIEVLFNSLEKERNILNEKVQKSEKEQFISHMSKSRLEQFEEDFSLMDIGTLTERKNRLLEVFQRKTPFTLPFLENYLSKTLGTNQWFHFLDYENYEYTLFLEYSKREDLPIIKNYIDTIMPAHILLHFHFFSGDSTNLTLGLYLMETGSYIHKIKYKEENNE